MATESAALTVKHRLREREVSHAEEVCERPRPGQATPARLGAALKRPPTLFMVCLIALGVIAAVAWQLPSRATRWDFSIYYVEATLLHQGHNPYTKELKAAGDKLGLETGEIRNATDPPTFILCMEPLALMS